jgi:hypothetical protein
MVLLSPGWWRVKLSYETDFDGRLEITPALTRAEDTQLKETITARNLPFVVETYVAGTRRSFLWIGQMLGRHARDEVPVQIADLLHQRLPTGHTAHGAIEAKGSAEDDLWAIEVRNGQVRVLEGTWLGIVYQGWDEGEVVEPRDDQRR